MITYRHPGRPCTSRPAADRALVEIEAAAWVAAHPSYSTDLRFEMASEAARLAGELEQAARQARQVLTWLDDVLLDPTGGPATADPTPPRRQSAAVVSTTNPGGWGVDPSPPRSPDRGP